MNQPRILLLTSTESSQTDESKKGNVEKRGEPQIACTPPEEQSSIHDDLYNMNFFK